jgi:hypothetical protein
MKPTNSQSGFTPIHFLLLLVILGIIGFAGWRVYSTGQQSNSDLSSSSAQSNTIKKEDDKRGAYSEYKNKDLGFVFSYPQEWGSASIKQGELVSPAHGDYQQITFDKKPEIDINVVVGGAFSPLDGCPDPVYMQKHGLAMQRATLTGWDGMDSILAYNLDYEATVNNDTSVYNVTKHPSVINGKNVWTKIRSRDKALAFQWVYFEPVKAGETCGDTITQQAADEANSYFKYIYFVRSFTSTKIKGINATYDARIIKTDLEIDQTLEVLNSVKAL